MDETVVYRDYLVTCNQLVKELNIDSEDHKKEVKGQLLSLLSKMNELIKTKIDNINKYTENKIQFPLLTIFIINLIVKIATTKEAIKPIIQGNAFTLAVPSVIKS